MKRGFSLSDLSGSVSVDSDSGMKKKKSKTTNKGKAVAATTAAAAAAAASQPATCMIDGLSSNIIDDAINDVLSQSVSHQSQHEVMPGAADGNTALVQSLLEKIDNQQATINNLERKLNSVLSFL